MRILKRFRLGAIDVNTYVVEHNNLHMLIDCGKAEEELINFLKTEEIDLKYVFITHCHFDHIEGIDDIKNMYPEVKIVVPSEEKTYLNDPEYNLSNYFNYEISVNVRATTYNDIKVEGLEFPAISGHSRSSVLIVAPEDNIMFSGDTIFHGGVGRSDLYYGDHNNLINGIKTKAFVYGDSMVIYPGHGPKTTVKREKENIVYKG